MHDPVWWIFFKETLDKSVIIVTSLSLVSRAQKSSLKTVLYFVKRFRCLVEA